MVSNNNNSEIGVCVQGKANKTRKFAQVKRMLNPKDPRLQKSDQSKQIHKAKDND